MPLAKALATGALRAPPPGVSLERADPGSGAAWAVTMRPSLFLAQRAKKGSPAAIAALHCRPLPPASAVLFTADGSLPKPGSKGTLQAPQASPTDIEGVMKRAFQQPSLQDGPILLGEGGQVFAVAAAWTVGLGWPACSLALSWSLR